MSLDAFNKLFYPKTIAFIGASANPSKWGFMILHHLEMGGYEGKVYPVNPKGGEIFGRKIYPNIASIPGEVDMAIFTVEAKFVPDLIDECAKKGVKAAVVISAGFRELGDASNLRMEEDMVARARRAGMIIVGPNGQGIVNTTAKLFPWMPTLFPQTGNIAVMSQSGNIATYVVEEGLRFGMGISKCVSTGNQADLKMEDYLEYLATDDETKAVVCYIEGIDDGRRFIEKASKVTRKKPVVAIKAGRTDEGAKAAKSHTGAIAASDRLVSAALKQSGVMRATNIEEAWAMAATSISAPLPKGDRLAIITGGGGLGVLAADAIAMNGLKLAKLPEKSVERLKAIMPAWWVAGNPVDQVAGIGYASREQISEILLESDEIDGLLLLGGGWTSKVAPAYKKSSFSDQYGINKIMAIMLKKDEKAMRLLADRIKSDKKPIYMTTNMAREAKLLKYDSLVALLDRGVYLFQSEELAARVYAELLAYSRYLANGSGNPNRG